MSEAHIRILLLGRTGVGKSSLINGLLRREAAPVGEWKPTTVSVAKYEGEFDRTRYTLIDTPGLCDDLPEVGNDERYLGMIKDAAPSVDHVWFVTRLDFTRVEADEKRGIQMITRAFGSAIWKHATIVFTFRDAIPTARADEALTTRGYLIRREIEVHAGPGVACNLRAVSVNSNDSAGLTIVRRPR